MGSIDHDMSVFADPHFATATLFDAATMGDKLVRSYEPNSISQYGSMLTYAAQLEQCVRFAIPEILVRIAKRAAEDRQLDAAVAETAVALAEAEEDTRLEEPPSSDDETPVLKMAKRRTPKASSGHSKKSKK